MITSVKFENFKCFKNFELTEMTPIVLVSGKNNTGKSTVLEGMFLFFDHNSPDSFIKLNGFRGINQPVANSTWDLYFNGLNTENPIRMNVCEDGVESELIYSIDRTFIPKDSTVHPDVLNQFIIAAKSNYSLMYDFTKNDCGEIGHFTISGAGILGNKVPKDSNGIAEMRHAQFINHLTAGSDMTINDWFGRIELNGKKDKVIELLQVIEPRLTDIRAISMSGQATLYATIADSLMPLKLCGDGINRLLYIICSIMENRDSVIFIDEIEIGFHYSVYNQIWQLIAKAAKENNSQLIITTHSFECIVGAVEGIKAAERCNDFTYYRLERNGDTTAKKFTYELLAYATESNMEVR